MSSEYFDKLVLSCNWETGNERNIKDTITFGNSDDDGGESELSDIVRVETCVQLRSPNPPTSTPELSFAFAPDLAITALKIVSEARIIELYGKGGEYMSTTHSDFLDDFEGMAVYSAFVKLATPSSECSIKLKKIRNQDSIWFYGMGVYVQASETENLEGSTVNIKSVNERLQQSGCDLAGNAKKCWRLLNTFQSISNASNVNGADGREPNSAKNAELHKKMCDLFLSVSPMLSNLRPGSPGASNVLKSLPGLPNFDLPSKLNLGQLNAPVSSSVKDEMKALISEQFQQLENSLIARVDERLKKIEDKLDMLVLTLQTQNLNLD